MPSAIQSTAVTQFEQFSRFAADALMKGDKTAAVHIEDPLALNFIAM